jgi:hypothetical protein
VAEVWSDLMADRETGSGSRRGLIAFAWPGGIRNLGFGEREAREALREAGAHVGNGGGVESLMRTALERLTRNGWEKAS